MSSQSRADDRKEQIMSFVSQNQYCMAEDIVKGLTGKISRVTIFRLLKEMTEEGVIENHKAAENARSNRFRIDETNPLFIAQRDLNEFRKIFFTSLTILKQRYPKAFQFSKRPKIEFPEYSPEANEWMFSGRFELVHDLITIFHAMLDRVMFMAKAFWGPRIPDPEIRLKFYGIVFLKINELENELLNVFDEKLQPFIRTKLGFWEHEKLHSIYSDLNEGVEARVIAMAESSKIEGLGKLVELIQLPKGVNVL